MSELRRLTSPEGTIDIDERFWPVVIVTWRGNNGVAAVREFFAWNESILPRARAEGGYLMITDADGAQRPPPEVRRLVAELNDALPDETKDLSIGNYVVITSALVRGPISPSSFAVSRAQPRTSSIFQKTGVPPLKRIWLI